MKIPAEPRPQRRPRPPLQLLPQHQELLPPTICAETTASSVTFQFVKISAPISLFVVAQEFAEEFHAPCAQEAANASLSQSARSFAGPTGEESNHATRDAERLQLQSATATVLPSSATSARTTAAFIHNALADVLADLRREMYVNRSAEPQQELEQLLQEAQEPPLQELPQVLQELPQLQGQLAQMTDPTQVHLEPSFHQEDLAMLQ